MRNLYTVTAAAWKPDGSQLAVGSLCGGVDLFEACARKQMFQDRFEFTYVSGKQACAAAAGPRPIWHYGAALQASAETQASQLPHQPAPAAAATMQKSSVPRRRGRR